MLPAKVSDRLRILQWMLPLSIVLMAALYQLGPARYVSDHYSHDIHWAVEVLFYGTSGPLVVWFSLRVIRHWNLEKELAEADVMRLNVELQQRVEERTQELREKNEALAAANRQLHELDQLKSEFVSLVSHELRAPLTRQGEGFFVGRGWMSTAEQGEAR